VVTAKPGLHPVGHFAGRAVVGLTGVVAAATAFGLLLVLVRVGWPPLERFDRTVAVWLNRAVSGQPGELAVLEAVTRLGGNQVVWWLVTVTAAGMLVRRQYALAAYLFVTGLGAVALAPLVKLLVGRLRPEVPHPVATAPGNSFPSGHALNATVFCGALLLVFLPIIPRRLRAWAIGLVAVLVVAIGFTRAALGVHYASDVLAGWLLGVAWLGITVHAFRHWRAEIGLTPERLAEGLEPEAAPRLAPTRIVPVSHPWLIAASLVVAWVLVAGGMYGIGLLVAAHPPAFDERIPQWFATHRTDPVSAVARLFSQAGNTHWILAIALVIGPLAIALIRRWRPAVFLAVALVGEVSLFLVVAAAVGRARPDVSRIETNLPTASFPSGHVAATTCLYGALAILVVPRTRGRWRWAALGLAIAMPALVALSRIYYGVHHPLDVTGGVVLAAAWLTAVTLAIQPNADLPGRRSARLRLAAPRLVLPGTTPAPAKRRGNRAAVVANPVKLAHPQARRAEIGSALAAAGWPEPMWLETTPDDPGRGQTERAIAAGVDVVIAAGGDGTVMSCVNALAGTPVALAVLPSGTGNLLARNMSLPADVTGTVATVTAQSRRRLDVGVVEDSYFAIMAGLGFDAQMLHDAPEQLKARIGWPGYAVAAVRHLCEAPMRVTISLDHASPFERRARSVLIGNFGRLQGGVRLLPDAVPDDGLLDVAVLMPARRRSWFRLAWALLWHRPTVPSLEIFQAKHVEVYSDRSQPRELDGDLIAPSRTLTATVRPAALWLCVPDPPGG
jgi:undecaprenyl-diphosphatase